MKRTFATISLLTFLVIGFLIELATRSVADNGALLGLGALPGSGDLHREYWRVATYSFLHFDAVHLLLNVALLLWVGRLLERERGAITLLIIYTVSVTASAAVILLVHRWHPQPDAIVGASGGNFGLLSAALIFSCTDSGAKLQRRRLWLLAVLVAGFIYSLFPRISMAGHIGGVIGGITMAVLACRTLRLG